MLHGTAYSGNSTLGIVLQNQKADFTDSYLFVCQSEHDNWFSFCISVGDCQIQAQFQPSSGSSGNQRAVTGPSCPPRAVLTPPGISPMFNLHAYYMCELGNDYKTWCEKCDTFVSLLNYAKDTILKPKELKWQSVSSRLYLQTLWINVRKI